MNKPTTEWLAALSVDQTVLVEVDGRWDQATILKILGNPTTPMTLIEVQPRSSRIKTVRADTLRPMTPVKARIVIELETNLGLTSIEQFREILTGNLKAAVDQGLLTVDTEMPNHLQAPGCIDECPSGGAPITTREIKVTVANGMKLFTPEQRKEVIDRLVSDMVDSLSNSDDYCDRISRQGHVGYETLSDLGLRDEFHLLFGAELQDSFEWAKDGQVD